jgi:hypothetical protein
MLDIKFFRLYLEFLISFEAKNLLIKYKMRVKVKKNEYLPDSLLTKNYQTTTKTEF